MRGLLNVAAAPAFLPLFTASLLLQLQPPPLGPPPAGEPAAAAVEAAACADRDNDGVSILDARRLPAVQARAPLSISCPP